MPIRAILFDVYGTLLDVHSAIAREGKELGADAESISLRWRQKQLEYTWVYSLRGEYRGFRTVTEAALDFALVSHKVESAALRTRLLHAYEQLDPFPDVADALAALKGRGVRAAALSNGDPDMLEAGLRTARVRSSLDAVLSVAPLKVYKPDRRVYELGRDWARAPAAEIAFASSNAWDAAGAAAFGFRTFWCNRGSAPAEYDIERRATAVRSLSEIIALLP
ncbi:MAG TPA: haloacid dehalogenase type II [Dongiaceae bacterium]|jgi:2-haloacid dehalogenase|nr:haloacid dehalogenase type II [Dongiaceae bacterium]